MLNVTRAWTLGALLDAIEAASPLSGVDVLAAELAKMVGAREVSFLIADYSGRSLVRLAHTATSASLRADDDGRLVPLAGTPQGQVLRTQQLRLQPARDGDGVLLYAPVTDRGEAVGVLELALPVSPDEATMGYLSSAAHVLAYLVIANRRYTDVFESGQRTSPATLEAEIQRRLLPASFTCEASQFTLAGWLVPATEIGGDTFDYTLDRDTLHMSITDAMGHNIDAALLATLLVGALRNSRRRGDGLAEQARAGNDALTSHARPDQFVTGQLVRLDLTTGTVGLVNAGHPWPLRIRGRTVTEITLAADPAFGISADTTYRIQPLALQPEDRLVLLTDGMLERNAARAHVIDLLADTRDLHPREATQALTAAVLQATRGHLRDDATILILDWYGGEPRDRDTTAGADTARAST